MVPDAEEPFAADGAGENLRHAHSQRRRAAGAIPKRDLADPVGQVDHGLRLQRIAPAADGCGSGVSSSADNTGGAVDREIHARRHGARGDHGHHADKRLEQHGAVANETSVAFAKDHLRRGAGGDQRVESADRATRNGNEAKWENLSGKDRAAAVDEARKRRH